MTRLRAALTAAFLLLPSSSHAGQAWTRYGEIADDVAVVPLADWSQREREGLEEWFAGSCRADDCRSLTEQERTRYGNLLAAAVRALPPAPKGFVRTTPLSLGPSQEVLRVGRWREWSTATRRSPELDGRGEVAAAVFPTGRVTQDGTFPSSLGVRVFYVPADLPPGAPVARDRSIRLDVRFHPPSTDTEVLFALPLAEVPFGHGAAGLVKPAGGGGSSSKAEVRRAFWLGRPGEGGKLMVSVTVEGTVKETDKLFDRISRTALLATVGPVNQTDARIEKGSSRSVRADTRFQDSDTKLSAEQRQFYGELVKQALTLLPVPSKEKAKQATNRTAVGELDRRTAHLGDAAHLVPAESIRCAGMLMPKEVSLFRRFDEIDAPPSSPGPKTDLKVTFEALCRRPKRWSGNVESRLDKWKVELNERAVENAPGRLEAQLIFVGSKVPADPAMAPIEYLVVTYEGPETMVRELVAKLDREAFLKLLK